ncbi:Protein of unknown function [Lactobacillus delbrueckii subsp. lactis]|nr:Putative uncharacterized protein [Lactobacillus delbrueckii subsp. lactis]CDR84644.1 Protein of unknown function [Lactobacillus delbrueckii subsp. lactis]
MEVSFKDDGDNVLVDPGLFAEPAHREPG